jgi:ribonuclease HII
MPLGKTSSPWGGANGAKVRTVPTFDLEAELMDQLHGPIVGIDEAGRGPGLGPVVVAAVILNPDRIPEGP